MSVCLGGGWAWVRWGKIKCAAIWVGLCEGIAALFILRRIAKRLCRPCTTVRSRHKSSKFAGCHSIAANEEGIKEVFKKGD